MFLNNHDYLQDHEVYTYKYTKTYLWVALGFSFIIGFFLIFFYYIRFVWIEFYYFLFFMILFWFFIYKITCRLIHVDWEYD